METLNLGDFGLLRNQLPPIVRLRIEGVVAWASWWSRDASRCHFA